MNPVLVVSGTLTNILALTSFWFVFLSPTARENDPEWHPADLHVNQALQVVLGHAQVEKQWPILY